MPGCQPVQPDFVLVRIERASIIYDGRIRGAPDLIAEVLSPGNRSHDEETKLAAYARAGVPEYVIVASFKRQLRLHSQPVAEEYRVRQIFNADDQVNFTCLPGVSVRVLDLFTGSPDETL